MPGQERNLAGAETVAGRVVQVEVLELVRANRFRGLLRGPGRVAGGMGHQLRGNLRIEDGLEEWHW